MTGIEKFGYYAAMYLDDVKNANKSMNTVNNYAKAFKNFTEYWKSVSTEFSTEEDPKSNLFRSWRNSMMERGLKPSTVKQRLMALHVFFSYFEDEEEDDGNLVYDGRNPVSKKLYPKQEHLPYDIILSDEDVAKLWANRVPSAKQKHNWARNYAIVTLFLTSKIRNGEMLSLRLCDIDFENEVLYVEHGKGNKFRCATLHPLAASAIKLYLASGLRPRNLTETDYLFGTMADETGRENIGEWHRGTTQWLSELVRRHVKTITGVDNVRSHDLRHVGARISLNSMEADKDQLQAELGHSSVRTTEIYSGMLEARRTERAKTKETMRIRDEWASRNEAVLESMM